MKICTNCCFVHEEEHCPVCGSKNARLVQNDDFCLFTENGSAYCEELTGVFDERKIPYSAMPYGSGVNTHFGMPLENYRIFVPYAYLDEAKRIMRDIDSEETEYLRNCLLEGVENLNISAKTEKKIRRKVDLSANEDIFEYCTRLIKTANKIVDKGTITGCLKGGHYYFCYADEVTLAVNSRTYEILSITTSIP